MGSKAHDDLNSIVISDTVLTAVTLMCSLKYVTFFPILILSWFTFVAKFLRSDWQNKIFPVGDLITRLD